MKLSSGRVVGREVKRNRDGERDTLLLQVEVTAPEDIQTVELINRSGEQNNPPDGSRVIIAQVGPAWKIAIADDDGIVPDILIGEKRIYSTDSGGAAIQSQVHCKNDGSVEVSNDNTEVQIDPFGNVAITAPGQIEINCPESIITGNVTINGNLVVTGNITSTQTVSGASLSGGAGGINTAGTVSATEVEVGGKAVGIHTHPIISGSSAPGPTGEMT